MSLTKRQENQIRTLGALAFDVAIEAAKNEYPDEVRQRLALAKQHLEAAHSILKVPS